MTPRQRVRTAIERGIPDRVPKCDSYWVATLDRWHQEGMPSDANAFEHFGIEWQFVFMDASLQLEEELIEETDEYAIRRNAYGLTARYSRTQEAPAEILDAEIKTQSDWERLKGRMVANRDRIAVTGFYSLVDDWTPPEMDWETRKAQLRAVIEGDHYVVMYFYGGFESLWRKVGFTQALTAMAEEPDWMRDMIEAHTDMVIDTYKLMHDEGLHIDGVLLSCDMAYKTGPLFSPKMFRELELPSMKRMWDAFRELGVQAIYHGDGNFEEFIPLLIEAGIQCIQPMEVNAGMDVRDLKRKYGRDLAFMGNISHDEMMMPDEEQAKALIQDKVRVASEGGGYVYHSDHSIPPSVSLQRYERVLSWVDEVG